MKLNIMGNEWTLEERSYKEDPVLDGSDGYCDWTVKLIVVEREMEGGTLLEMEQFVKKVKRHEIVHAYLMECGLAECSGSTDAWALNESMVDWFARVGPRIVRTWEEAGAMP